MVEAAIEAAASSGQEKTVAVTCSEESAVYTILCRQCTGRVVVEFFPFLFGRHTPSTAPVGRGGIILGQQRG